MSETVKPRRRWPWRALAVVALVVGGLLAWRFRPLNGTERALVGKWKGDYGEVTFRSNRRFEAGDEAFGEGPDETGTWSATEDQLLIDLDVPGPLTWGKLWQQARSFFRSGPPDSGGRIEFLTPDKLQAENPSSGQPPEIWERISK